MAIPDDKKNALFKAIEQAGLLPADFELKIQGEGIPKNGFVLLRRVRPLYSIHVDFCPHNQFSREYSGWRFTFGPIVVDSWGEETRFHDWNTALAEGITQWLHKIKADANEPDLWAEQERFANSLLPQGAQFLGDDILTERQHAELCKRLDEIEAAIREQDLLAENQSEQLHADLDALKRNSQRQTVRQVLFTLLGILVSVALALPEEIRGKLGEVVRSAFTYVVGVLKGS